MFVAGASDQGENHHHINQANLDLSDNNHLINQANMAVNDNASFDDPANLDVGDNHHHVNHAQDHPNINFNHADPHPEPAMQPLAAPAIHGPVPVANINPIAAAVANAGFIDISTCKKMIHGEVCGLPA